MLWRFLTIAILIFSGPIWSANYATAPKKKVVVNLSIYLADVFFIDDSKKSADVKFFITTRWNDRRLKGKYKKATSIPINEIWHPRIELMSRKNLVPDTNKVVSIDPEGNVKRLVRYTGSISFKANYTDFPFDRQTLVFDFITPNKEVILKKGKSKTLRSKKFAIEGWVFDDGTFEKEDVDLGRGVPILFEGLVLRINGERKSTFYLLKIFYPLTIILLIAGSIFGINPAQIPARISVTTIATLTLVAYDFIIASMVPTLSYLTKIDVFYFSALSMVFFAFSGAVFTSHLGTKDIAKAVKLSHILGAIYLVLIIVLYIVVLR
jgi:hypothetical protein